MRDDKSKQESQFNLEAIKESIERMKPELSTCSAAAHRAKGADDGDDPDTDRAVELGYLVECLSGMCGPHLMLLHEIATPSMKFTRQTRKQTRNRKGGNTATIKLTRV